jgi:hypothetical protein
LVPGSIIRSSFYVHVHVRIVIPLLSLVLLLIHCSQTQDVLVDVDLLDLIPLALQSKDVFVELLVLLRSDSQHFDHVGGGDLAESRTFLDLCFLHELFDVGWFDDSVLFSFDVSLEVLDILEVEFEVRVIFFLEVRVTSVFEVGDDGGDYMGEVVDSVVDVDRFEYKEGSGREVSLGGGGDLNVDVSREGRLFLILVLG